MLEKIGFWRDMRKGALTRGKPCPRDIDLMVGEGTINRQRMSAVCSEALRESWKPMLAVSALVLLSAGVIASNRLGIQFSGLADAAYKSDESPWPGRAQQALETYYGAGLAGRYELSAISKVIPGWNLQAALTASNVERVLSAEQGAQEQLASECKSNIGNGLNCTVAGLIAYRHVLNGEPASSIYATSQGQLEYFSKLYLQIPGKCDNYKSNGFYTTQKNGDVEKNFADVVFANALDTQSAVAVIGQIGKSWSDKSFPTNLTSVTKVKSLKELVEHRQADSCNPISVTSYQVNGGSLEYLVSVISRNGNSVSTALFGLAESKGYRVARLIKCKDCDINLANAMPAIDLASIPDTAKDLAKEFNRNGMKVEGI